MSTQPRVSAIAITVALSWLAMPGPALAQISKEYRASGSDLGLTDAESVKHYDEEPTPAAGSPNVVYIVLDDTGFSDIGSFGSEIKTPSMDALAKQGLRYNNFNSRAICSPTRAALLTGRNSHSVGVANVVNMLSGFPHGQGRISHQAATVAEMLQSSGYRTFAVGKWHLAPLSQTSSREHWPVQRGFNQFYGFLDGMTDQYYPDIVVDNTPMDIEHKSNYHVSEDLVDKAIGYVASTTAASPGRPFFLYVSFGATHSPHQVPASYIEKYKDVYTKGWDAIRAERFARQKELGIIPKDAKLAPRNPGVKPWSELTPVEKEVNARFQATYAAFMEHTDEQVGRLVDFLKKSGQFDNTVIVLLSDNGGSIEGHDSGTLNEAASLNRVPESADGMIGRINEFGSKTTYMNDPSGWAQVSNTPFQFYKTTVWDGGTRTPLIISYPRMIKGGEVRNQFVDVIDVTPTILDITKITAPTEYRGIPQMPVAGASFKASFNDPSVGASRHTQYFELLGQRAIWHDGWKAVSEHVPGQDFFSDKWHLYNLNVDFSAVDDLASRYPAKLQDLKDRWWSEAGKYGVLPLVNASLLGSFSTKASSIPAYKTRRETRPEYVYYAGQAQLIRADGPQIGSGSFKIAALVAPTTGRESGVLIADGDAFGGYTLYIKEGRLTFEQSDLGVTRTKVVANSVLGSGVKRLEVRFKRTDANGGVASLYYDDVNVGSGTIAKRTTNLTSVSGFGIGKDVSGPVSNAYPEDNGFPLSGGVLDRVVVSIEP